MAGKIRRIRLVVRTQPSQGWCTGSIPVCAAFQRHMRSSWTSPLPVVPAALVLCFLLGFTSCRPSFDRQVSGAVLALHGMAEQTKNGKKFPLAKGAWISPGARVTTAPGGNLDLMLLPGMLVGLAGDTEIQIEQLRLARDGNESIHPMTARQARIRILRGTLVVAINRVQTRAQLAVETPEGSLSAGSGRTFKISVEGGRTRLMCVRGRTAFHPTPGGKITKIGPGYFTEWPAIAPEPKAAAAAGAQAQAELVAILSVERRLRHLEKREQGHFRPWRNPPQTAILTPGK